MGVVEHAQQAVGVRQVDRLAQQRQRLLAAAVEREGAQAQQLDVQAALLAAPARSASARASGSSGAPPVLRGDRRVAQRQLAQQRRRCAATAALAAVVGSASSASICAHSSRQVSARKRRACSRTWSARLAMRRRGRRRATPTASQRAEQLERAVLGALGRRRCAPACGSRAAPPRAGRCAPARRAGWPAARRPRRAGCAPTRAAASSAASMQANGLRRPRSPSARASVGRSRLLGQQHLAFPQVGQADDEVAPAAEVAAAPRPCSPRGACCWRRRASAGSPSSSVRNAERLACTCSSSGSRQRRRPRPTGRAARRSGRDRRRRPRRRSRISAHSQRSASSTPGCARMRSTKRLGLLVALAQRQRPGGGQQQARPAVELRRPAAAPAIRAPCPGARAPSAIRTGCARPGRRRVSRWPAASACSAAASSRPCSASQSRGARVQRGLLVGRQRGEAAAQRVARQRVHAQPLAAPRRRRRPACRAPAAPAARRRRRRRATRAAQLGMQGSRIGDARQEGDVGRVEVGQQQVDEAGRAARRRCAAISDDLGAAGRCRAAITDSASCRPSGQPSVSSCRRAAASRSTRLPKRVAHQLDRLVELEAQLRRRRRRRTGRRRPGRRCRGRQSARAATTTRRLDGALRSR